MGRGRPRKYRSRVIDTPLADKLNALIDDFAAKRRGSPEIPPLPPLPPSAKQDAKAALLAAIRAQRGDLSFRSRDLVAMAKMPGAAELRDRIVECVAALHPSRLDNLFNGIYNRKQSGELLLHFERMDSGVAVWRIFDRPKADPER